MADPAPDAFVAMTADGRITAWNLRAQQLFGWAPEEALGASVAELIVPPEQRAVVQAHLRTDAPGRFEDQLVCRDGTRLAVQMNVCALDEPGGTTVTAFIRPR